MLLFYSGANSPRGATVSDPIENTAGGATRVLFGSLAFILLMVGVEGMTGVAPTTIPGAIILLIFGVMCAYAAVFWENAKKIFSIETQEKIANFASNRITKFGMLFLVLQALLLSPFIEQHRWPFSYHAGDAEFNEITRLRQQISALGPVNEFANEWRFVKLLRDANAGVCHYQLVTTPKARSTFQFWNEQLHAAGWTEDVQAPTNINLIQPGITLRIPTASSNCSSVLQRALTDLYPNPPSKVVANQQINCDGQCVIIELDY
jgi:hypothetical protein